VKSFSDLREIFLKNKNNNVFFFFTADYLCKIVLFLFEFTYRKREIVYFFYFIKIDILKIEQ